MLENFLIFMALSFGLHQLWLQHKSRKEAAKPETDEHEDINHV